MSHEGKGLQITRNCPFLDKQQKSVLEQKHEESSLRNYEFSFERKKRKQKKKGKEVITEEEKPKQTAALVVCEYEIYSCPAATMSDNMGLTRMIDLINWSSDMHTPLLDGGLLNHTSYYFECYRTVIGEQRAIENEEMKKRQKDTEFNKKKGKGKSKMGRPRSGKASRARRK